MIKIELTLQKFQELVRTGHSLDTIFLLYCLDEMDLKDPDNPKLAIMNQSLIRKGLITIENKLTLEGEDL